MDSVASLSLGDLENLPTLLSIIPSANLFGFPFILAPREQIHLGESLQVAIVPSVSWLVATRSEDWSGNLSRKAWLGSSHENPAHGNLNIVLRLLRNRLSPLLEEYEFEIVEGKFPNELEFSSLVVVTSHGDVGLFDYFSAVSDTAQAYSAREFASHFEGCGCVVLFVCSAGRSDAQTGSSETLGLVSELLGINISRDT
ncbi:MAG: hypothetical protein GY845_35865 [Planctomycetes bacterium]|nr:hypothetical protein [Planctomycetota bacterium]